MVEAGALVALQLRLRAETKTIVPLERTAPLGAGKGALGADTGSTSADQYRTLGASLAVQLP